MNGIGWAAHFGILMALLVNLWVGGDLVEARFGHVVRSGLELLLIASWLVLVVGMRVPLPWRRRDEERDGRDR